ncbi:uncharacterized protein LOC135098365 isoform X1 [Scylla paramamosain]|uniref:uncharacterized protein LOC135098365 isoform X1 n=1 Tax=Scylla paramamosain TaxID=85552 RepID=UPI0030827136
MTSHPYLATHDRFKVHVAFLLTAAAPLVFVTGRAVLSLRTRSFFSSNHQRPRRCKGNAGAASQPPLGLMEVVNLQQFDGSWGLKDAAHLTAVPLDALCRQSRQGRGSLGHSAGAGVAREEVW